MAEAIRFTAYGSGPEHVLVLHDWNGDHTTYDPILPYLTTKAFTYAFVDLRGYGASRDLPGEYTAAEVSRDCLGVVDRLGWDRFHVLGHSMTGMATHRIAVDGTARVKSAIAVCPVSAAGFPMDEQTWNFFSSATSNDDAYRQFMRAVSGKLSDSWLEAKLRQNRSQVSPACRIPYLTMFSKTNFAEEAKKLRTPYLVVLCEHDSPGLTEAAKQTFLAWHPGAEHVMIPNCGHFPMQECPPYFATVIERFLSKHTD